VAPTMTSQAVPPILRAEAARWVDHSSRVAWAAGPSRDFTEVSGVRWEFRRVIRNPRLDFPELDPGRSVDQAGTVRIR
jgi:hypothetical protein